MALGEERFFLECERNRVFWLLMMCGGMLGAFTYCVRGGVFCNAQTGNIVLFGMAVGNGNWKGAAYLLVPITAYGLGACNGCSRTYPDYFVAAFPTCEAYNDEWLTDSQVNAARDMPIWFTHAKDDTVVPINVQAEGSTFSEPKFEKDKDGNYIPTNDFSTKVVERLRAAGGKNIHLTLFENVTDQTGKYFKEDGKSPYQYNGRFSRIYVLNNECAENMDGRNVTIMEWLASQKRTGEGLGYQNAQASDKTAITVAKSKYAVRKGKTVRIDVSVNNAGNQKVTYKSKNKKIAAVNEKGIVRGIKKGSTTVVIQCNGVTKRVKVTVKG